MHSPLNPHADLSRLAPRPARRRAGRTTSHGPATQALLRRGSPGAPADPPIAGGGADPSSDLPTMRRDATTPPDAHASASGGGVPAWVRLGHDPPDVWGEGDWCSVDGAVALCGDRRFVYVDGHGWIDVTERGERYRRHLESRLRGVVQSTPAPPAGGVPPVMGGQGRDASDVVVSAVAAVVCLIALALVAVGVL